MRLLMEALDRLGLRYVVLHQRRVASVTARFTVDESGTVAGTLSIEGRAHAWEDFRGGYIRLMDDRFLPEVVGTDPGDPLRRHARAVHDVVSQWSDVAPGVVINRPAAMASNGSKPYQAQLIRDAGFAIPETLITNNPDLVREFRARHGRVVYKSVSGVRSVVQILSDEDDARLHHIAWCPTQFQAYVPGDDVRVHVVGDAAVATAVESNVADYRYAGQVPHGRTALRPVTLDDSLSDKCVSLAADLGLVFAGIDLRVTASGEAYCFEVNPCPAYSYYELGTGQAISALLADELAGRVTSVSGPSS
jgi:hypothetical protein